MTAIAKAVLYVDGLPPTGGVSFQFNPTAIGISHSPDLDHRGAPTKKTNPSGGRVEVQGGDNAAAQLTIEKLGRTSFRLSAVTFDGAGTRESCEKLLTWSYPYKNERGKLEMTQLIFQWGQFSLGSYTKIPVILAKADISYERFSARGKPTRAKVQLELLPCAGENPFQNPTSGGRPGRREYILVNGDTLASIAVNKYGKATEWRRLAELNGVDDPLRMRPGAALYVPGHAELHGRPT